MQNKRLIYLLSAFLIASLIAGFVIWQASIKHRRPISDNKQKLNTKGNTKSNDNAEEHIDDLNDEASHDFQDSPQNQWQPNQLTSTTNSSLQTGSACDKGSSIDQQKEKVESVTTFKDINQVTQNFLNDLSSAKELCSKSDIQAVFTKYLFKTETRKPINLLTKDNNQQTIVDVYRSDFLDCQSNTAKRVVYIHDYIKFIRGQFTNEDNELLLNFIHLAYDQNFLQEERSDRDGFLDQQATERDWQNTHEPWFDKNRENHHQNAKNLILQVIKSKDSVERHKIEKVLYFAGQIYKKADQTQSIEQEVIDKLLQNDLLTSKFINLIYCDIYNKILIPQIKNNKLTQKTIDALKKYDKFNINHGQADALAECIEENRWSQMELLIKNGADITTKSNGKSLIFRFFDKIKSLIKDLNQTPSNKENRKKEFLNAFEALKEIINKDKDILAKSGEFNMTGKRCFIVEMVISVSSLQKCNNSGDLLFEEGRWEEIKDFFKGQIERAVDNVSAQDLRQLKANVDKVKTGSELLLTDTEKEGILQKIENKIKEDLKPSSNASRALAGVTTSLQNDTEKIM